MGAHGGAPHSRSEVWMARPSRSPRCSEAAPKSIPKRTQVGHADAAHARLRHRHVLPASEGTRAPRHAYSGRVPARGPLSLKGAALARKRRRPQRLPSGAAGAAGTRPPRGRCAHRAAPFPGADRGDAGHSPRDVRNRLHSHSETHCLLSKSRAELEPETDAATNPLR